MARINILHSSHEGRVRLNLNGREHIVSVPQGGKGEATVPDEFLPLLTDSNIDYEIVEPVVGNDEAGEGARGDSGADPAELLGDGPIPGTDPETLPSPGEPTPGVESAGFDASSNTAMPATPPNPSPSAPAPPEAAKASGGGADPAGKATAGAVAKPKVAPAGSDKPKAAAKPKKAAAKAK